MFRIAQLLLMICLLGPALRVLAQQSFTVQEAIACALASNPARKAAQCEVAAAVAHLQGARLLRNPEIFISPTVSGFEEINDFLFITQPLELNGTRTARTRIAAGQLAAVQAGARITDRDLALAVALAYWDLAQTQSIAALDAENVTYAETQVAVVKKQFELGKVPAAQVTKAEVESARACQQSTRAQAAVEQAQTVLNTVMGRDPATAIALAEALIYTPVPLNDEVLFSLSQTYRPEVVQAQALVRSAAGGVDAARAARRPDIELEIAQNTWNSGINLGVGFTLPFIDWGSAAAERRRAQAALSAQQQRVDATRNRVRQEVSAALITVHSAETQICTFRDRILKPTQQLADLAQQGYQEGATDYLEVLEAHRTLRAVNAEYCLALGDYQRALAQLAWAVGLDHPAALQQELTQ